MSEGISFHMQKGVPVRVGDKDVFTRDACMFTYTCMYVSILQYSLVPLQHEEKCKNTNFPYLRGLGDTDIGKLCDRALI